MKKITVIFLVLAGSFVFIDRPVAQAEPKDSAASFYHQYRQFKRLTKNPRHISPLVLGSCRTVMPVLRVSDKGRKQAVDPVNGTLIKRADEIFSEQGKSAADPHLNTRVHIYVNTLADEVITRKLKSFPVGAVIVKEKLELDGFIYAVRGIGGMIKRTSGYDSENGDWEYFYTDKTTDFISGRLKNCVECHTDARDTDYVFSVWKIYNNQLKEEQEVSGKRDK